MRGAVGAGARLAVGTLTVFPVRVERVDRVTAGSAMLWAPGVGALLGALTGAVAVLGTWSGLPAALAALLGVGTAALLTRGLHLDGLADLADGLGSARPAEGALEVMRRSDIGPFGVITLIVVLGAQTLALGGLAETSPWAALAGATVAGAAGRLAITWACTPGVPAARPEGLGALVAGTVPVSGAVAASAGAVALCALGLLRSPGFAVACAVALAVGSTAAVLLRRRAVRRLGGVTGDVLGALSETGATATLIVAAGAVAWV
ncbi:adenosylcobinamide-GDP ribazoletransferase [Nocardiopsis lambiniae]|uniref:Adenosylcobinamide-GDP ribazoletransferase n=1 Tax=Nocardiopsis lambiniae TaxID=3075539 RepID=A0ABU2M7X7_9ACTN|nr:adenosylcobinamide-GDP ribazoletransferase [Nocardiopsis sp. DSM 44743]MDT0328770.1 adenosylcobinamide-GDP ribazoletransferase [Nocardiopsis sp. DSM 44743]